MTGGFGQKVDQAGRNVAPFAITAFLMLVGMVPLQLPGWGTVAPQFVLMAIYYWAIHRPDLLRPSFAFGLGVLHDLLSGIPLGLSALVFVLVYWVVLSQRRFFLAGSFAMLWFGFLLIACGASLVYWLGVSLLSLTLAPPSSTIAQTALTVALFPIFSWAFMRVHRAFLQDEA